MEIQEILKNLIKEAIDSAVQDKTLNAFEINEIFIERPREGGNGDFSSNFCLKYAGKAGKNPRELGDILVENLQKESVLKSQNLEANFFEKIEIAGPGFLNFYLADQFFAKNIQEILDKKEAFGDLEYGKGQRVLVEHTAVNPNKAIHVGHIRNSILGDSYAKILKKCGFDVQIENYIDDTGVQVADIVTALKHVRNDYIPGGDQKFDHFCWDLYAEVQKKFEDDEELKNKKLEILSHMEEGGNEISDYAEEVVDKILKDQLETLGKFGIHYDLLLSESAVLQCGLWESVFNELKERKIVEKEEEGDLANCWVVKDLDLPNKENMKNPDKVLVTSNGNIVYTAKDIAHHLWKFGLTKGDFLYKKFTDKKGEEIYMTSKEGESLDKFGHVNACYTVVDVRQSYSFDVIKAVFKKMGQENEAKNLTHLAYGFLSLSKKTAEELGVDTSDNKSSYAMSGRKGLGVKVDDLLEMMVKKVEEQSQKGKDTASDVEKGIDYSDIAVAAIKAYLLKFNVNSEVIFDFEESMKVTGDSGPYLQYTHARIRGILRKSELKNYTNADLGLLIEAEEKSLMRMLQQFPQVIEEAQKTVSPNLVYNYLIDLCQSFNSFYNKHSVLKAEKDLQLARLLLIDAVSIVIKNGLDLMGVKAPEKM